MQTFHEWLEAQENVDESLMDLVRSTGRKLAYARYGVTGPLKAGKWLGVKAFKIGWNTIAAPYKTLRNAYGTPAALAILAGSLGLHVMFPAFAAIPSSILLGSAPGIVTADTIQLLRGKETLIAQGVEELKKMKPSKLKALFSSTRKQIEQAAQANPQPEAV